VNQRTERANRITFTNRFFDHFNGAFDAETKSVFIR
jgi:hypothetical protein